MAEILKTHYWETSFNFENQCLQLLHSAREVWECLCLHSKKDFRVGVWDLGSLGLV